MERDVEGWLAGHEIDLEPKYLAAIKAVGEVPFMAELFRRFGDATLSGWLICLIFVWKELTFGDWKRILYRVSDDTSALYGFVIFVNQFLAIDIVSVIHEDQAVAEAARVFAASRFPGGGAESGSEWVRGVLQDNGVDVHRLWRRLAAEGAPMKLDPGDAGDAQP